MGRSAGRSAPCGDLVTQGSQVHAIRQKVRKHSIAVRTFARGQPVCCTSSSMVSGGDALQVVFSEVRSAAFNNRAHSG